MVFNLPSELLSFLVVIEGAALIILALFTLRIWRHYNRLTKGAYEIPLAGVLDRISSEVEENKAAAKDLRERAEKLRRRSRGFIQQVRLRRYNPFKNVGGDQSFILALMDEEKNGIVISSLHSRDQTRWFAKKLRGGKGEKHELSKEEEDVIREK